jgi:putative ABC transport system substrate-binding protein
MRRREFLSVLGGAAGSWPLKTRAQSAKRIIRIGVLWHAGNEREEAPFLAAFRQGLRELGYTEGQHFILVNTFASENYERFNTNAKELVELKVDILVAVNLQAALAAQRATKTIPIVFILVPDPVTKSCFFLPRGPFLFFQRAVRRVPSACCR